MTKRYEGQTIPLSVEIRDDGGDLADPTSVSFAYRIGTSRIVQTSPVTKDAVGLYSTVVTPDRHGNLYGTWSTQGTPLRAIPENVPVYPSNGPNGQAPWPWGWP